MLAHRAQLHTVGLIAVYSITLAAWEAAAASTAVGLSVHTPTMKPSVLRLTDLPLANGNPQAVLNGMAALTV